MNEFDYKGWISGGSSGGSSGDTNVQSDWNQADTTADDYIKNKPSIPVQASSVASGDTGYTTGDQVYNYISNEVGGAGFDPSSMPEITYPQVLNNSVPLDNKIKDVDNKRIEGDEALDNAKINKVSNPTEGNIPVLTQDGSISDSSKKFADLMPSVGNLPALTNFVFVTGDFVDSAPASSSSSGLKGQMYLDTDYIYYCVADNTWRRSALSTF